VNEDNDGINHRRNEEKIVNFKRIRSYVAEGGLIGGLKRCRLHPRHWIQRQTQQYFEYLPMVIITKLLNYLHSLLSHFLDY